MFALLIQLLLLIGVIVVAGTFLSKFADQFADATGFGKLLVGSILLAGATSLPELSVDVAAVRIGEVDLAMGDLLGSSLMNLLILAVLDLSIYSRGKMLSRVASAHALSAQMAIVLTGLIGIALLTTKSFPTWTFAGAHIWSWAIAAIYLLGVRVVFLDQRISVRAAEEAQPELTHTGKKILLWKVILGFAICAAVILVTGPYLAATAAEIAEKTGLGNSFVGTTLVAGITSLPELSASYAAIRLGSFDLAVGNVFGSNVFNMLLFLPLDIACSDSLFAVASPIHVVSTIAVCVATAFVVIGQLYHVEKRTRFLDPDAWSVIAVIVLGLVIVYQSSH